MVSKARTIIILLSVTGVLFLVLVFMTQFKMETLDIRSGSHYTPEEIKGLLIDGRLDNYAVIFALRHRNNKISLPFVEKIDVELVDKNTVIVYVYDKKIIGCIKHMGHYLYFDRDGIVVEEAGERLEGIPLITGDSLSYDRIVLGEKLDLGNGIIYETALNAILLLQKNEIEADRIDFGNRYELRIYIDGNIFMLGKDDNYDFKINNINALILEDETKYKYDMRNFSEENLEVDARPMD